ncbi:hypothetical protein RYH73_23160 [Olivibacter sp. CPCC 100613]|uniref:hypothetical protein n=1 Tax=Olivibacter sp. CPCC 100613 TaxID=3079931 RepID=UPI002FF7BC14
MNKKGIFHSFFLLLLSFLTVNAQEVKFSDQNPNFNRSLQRYAATSDSLLRYQGSTIQQTYKAYDWYQARAERKALRRERRHLERIANPSYNDWYYPSIGLGYYGYNNWGWSPYVGVGFNSRSFWY